MKVLRAPNDNTVTRVTSVGEVRFENGIATEFTNEQAQYFTEKQKGYELEEIESDETTAKEPAEATAAEPTQQEKSENDSDDSGEGGEDQESSDSNEGTGEADSTVIPPEGEQEETTTADDQNSGESEGQTEENGSGKGDPLTADETPETEGAEDGEKPEIDEPVGDIIHGNLRGLQGINVNLINVSRADTVATTVTDKDGNWAFSPPADQDSSDVFNVDFFGEGVEEGDDIKDVQVGMPYGDWLSDDSESEDDELMTDITKADHATLIEGARQAGIEVDEDWSIEDLREVMIAKTTSAENDDKNAGEGQSTAENEKPAESSETTEASQNASDDAQTAPTDVSSDEGSKGNEGDGESQDDSSSTDKSPEEPIKLPTGNDSRRKVAKFCQKYEIDDKGDKTELLVRIYADERFKK